MVRRNTVFSLLVPLATLISLACGSSPGASPSASNVSSLTAASSFAVLSAAPAGGGAVTCTDSIINGDVGSSGGMAAVVQTNCKVSGAIIAPVSAQVVTDFNTAYAALAATPCDHTLITLDGQKLSAGVYCFDAAATSTGSVLTLTGAGPWLFKIGTLGTGALTGTNFSVVMENGSAVPCNLVTWWVAQAATLTDSNFVGTIYAGAAITITRGTFSGDAFASAAVTITGATLNGCTSTGSSSHGGGSYCNLGVGNGPEGCDPGNSNNHNSSNDENGGIPGAPGRQGRK
jgi:hypothetical protein